MGPDCPSEQVVADFVARRVSASEAARIDQHVDRCASCRARIAFAITAPAPPPASLAATAPADPDELRGHPNIRMGTRIGRYQVKGRLGAGAMGVVYAAHDPKLDRQVAVKLLSDASDEGTRLVREGQALARVSHPNVVAVYDVGEHDGHVFIAMELVAGMTLSVWLREARARREILAMFLQAGHGLAAVHQAGFVHRDFKPDNVLVGRDGRARVTDFGLARLGDGPQSLPPDTAVGPDVRWAAITETGALVGTPAFMAPEQLDGQTVDARADQFAFCVALFEGLGHARPFAGDTLRALRASIAAGTIQEPRPAISARIMRVIRRGLAEAPADRFPTMDALLAMLGHDAARWRWRLAAVGGGIAMAGVAVAVSTRASTPDPCPDPLPQLAGIWDPFTKSVVRAAFTQTGKSYAQTIWRSVERTLDDYSLDWRAMQQASCRATHVRGDQSGELLDLRTECLVGRLAELDTVSELFERSDVALLDQAVSLADRLTPIDGCADVAALRAPLRPPEAPGARDEVAALARSFARARVLRDANHRDEARTLLTDGLQRARAIDYLPAEAEATYLLASIARRTGELATADTLLTEATLLAEAARDDKVKAWALTELIDVYRRQGKLDKAVDVARQADATVTRFGRAPSMIARLENNVGNVLSMQGKDDEALLHFEAADKAASTIIDGKPAMSGNDRASGLLNIGGVHFNAQRYVHAERYFRQALAIDEELLGPDHPDVASDLANLGAALRALGRIQEAEAAQLRALDIGERTQAAPDTLAVILNNLGNLVSEREPAKGLGYYERGRTLLAALSIDGPMIATLTNNIGACHLKARKWQEARRAFEEARRALLASVGPEDAELAVSYEGLAEIDEATDARTSAVTHRRRAVAIREKALPGGLDLAHSKVALAKALWNTGDRAEARKLAAEARSTYVATQDPALTLLDAWLTTLR